MCSLWHRHKLTRALVLAYATRPGADLPDYAIPTAAHQLNNFQPGFMRSFPGRLEINLRDGGALVVSKDPAAQQLHTSSPATGDVSYEYAGTQTWCDRRAISMLSDSYAVSSEMVDLAHVAIKTQPSGT